MKPFLPLFVFIDALGWEIIRNDPFGQSFAPRRRRLESVFGYSSACVPSILSGRYPAEHRNWCYFVYDPAHSPFGGLRWLRWLPKALTGRRVVRRRLSQLVKRQLRFQGYFDLYNLPFEHLPLFDFSEKKNPLQAGGLNVGPNIFDFLQSRQIPYHVSDPTRGESENLKLLLTHLQSEAVDFAFVYWPELDGLLHRVGNQSPEIAPRLRAYERRLAEVLALARRHYREVELYVFGDHGMANCDTLLDLKSRIEPLPFRIGKDYAVVYDSTMARFWFFNSAARRAVVQELQGVPTGTILSDEELERLHCLFPDRFFGELIFLVQEGVLIVPSDMGERPIRAMHGYHPREKHSYTALLTQSEVAPDVGAIPDVYRLMVESALKATERNQPGVRNAQPEALQVEAAELLAT